jgi:hypothetical protein
MKIEIAESEKNPEQAPVGRCGSAAMAAGGFAQLA